MNDEFNKTDPMGSPQPEPPKHKKLIIKINPIGGAFIGIITVGLLYEIIGGLITILITGVDISKSDPMQFRLMTIAGQMLFILLPAILLTKVFYEDVTGVMRVKLPNLREVVIFFIGILIIIPLIENITYIQTFYVDKLAASNVFFHRLKDSFDSVDKMIEGSFNSIFAVKSILDPIVIILAVSVTPAFCEEFFFRGFLMGSLGLSWKPVWAIIVTALIFSMFHFSPYGFLPILLLGLFLGYAAYKTNSIFTAVMIHFTNNFFSTIIYFIVGNSTQSSTPKETPGIEVNLFLLFVGIIILSAWVYYVERHYKKLKTSERQII